MTYGTLNADLIGNSNGQTGNAIGPGFKNRIINGAMVIDQRNAGASFAQTNGAYNLDRWSGDSYAGTPVTGKYTVQQNAGSVTPPTDFINYLGVTSVATTADASTNIFCVSQKIEGFNTADLAWGTANAKTVTLSFWVRSSLTGTFGGSVKNSASNRSYPFTYSISSANTWEYKTVTIAGDTTGTWVTNNGIGIWLNFGLGVGSSFSGTAGAWNSNNNVSATGATSVVGTNGATFYITGVQLEVGSVATPFERRPYGTELSLCQRYLPAIKASFASGVLGFGQAYNTTDAVITIPFPVSARIPPSGITISAVNHFNCWLSNTALANPTAIVFSQTTVLSATVVASGGTGFVAGNSTSLLFVNASGNIYFTGCEL